MTPGEAKYPDENLLVYGYYVGGIDKTDPPQFLDSAYLADQRLVGLLFDFTHLEGNAVHFRTWYGEDQVDTFDDSAFARTVDLGRFRMVGNLELAMHERFQFYIRSLSKPQTPDVRPDTFVLAKSDVELRQQITKDYILPLLNIAHQNPLVAKGYHDQLFRLTMEDLPLEYLIKMSETIINNGSDEALEKSLMYVAAYISAKNEDYDNLVEIRDALNLYI